MSAASAVPGTGAPQAPASSDTAAGSNTPRRPRPITDADVVRGWNDWFNPNLAAPVRQPIASDMMDRMSLEGIRRVLEGYERRRAAEEGTCPAT